MSELERQLAESLAKLREENARRMANVEANLRDNSPMFAEAEKTPTKRYAITQLQKVIDTLTDWRDATQDTLDNEESRDYPNEARVEKLSERIDALTDAIEALENIE